MRLLIDDAFAASAISIPIARGWVMPPSVLAVELVPGLTASEVTEGDAAFAPTFVLLTRNSSHGVVAEVAVVADGVGAAAMRTPVRPDEVEATPVRLLDAYGAELLARATLKPFYGIEPTAWLHDEGPNAARAEVVIVAGAEALREPEAGFSEDLSRAWFILTAQPVVSHVLLLPKEFSPEQRQVMLEFLTAAKTAGLARRREWRVALADREGISRDRAGTFWAAQRLELQQADRQALRALLNRGSQGLPYMGAANVIFIEGDVAR